MTPLEIEQAVSLLFEQPLDAAEFPHAFLRAFGNKDTVLQRLRNGGTNKYDVAGGVLQSSNIHIAAAGEVAKTLAALRESPATTNAKAKYVLATDGVDVEAENIATGETVVRSYQDFPNRFGFFLALAGISTTKEIRENAFDILATRRLRQLYVELLKDNPAWGTADRRHDMNHFIARLIFCFFAEDANIFNGDARFTRTVETMSAKDASDRPWPDTTC